MGPARPSLRGLLADKAKVPEPRARGRGARRGPRPLVIALVICWIALIEAGCRLLANSQANSRKGMAARLQTRTQLAANFVSIYAGDLISRQRAQAFSWFAAAEVIQDTLDRDARALGLQAAVVLDAHGRVLRTATARAPSLDQLLVRRFAALSDPATGPEASGVALTDTGGSPVLSFGVAYQSRSGRRVFTGAYEMSDTVLPTVLGQLLSNAGSRAYLVDANGGLLSSAVWRAPQPSTPAQADPRLWAADQRAPEGSYESPAGEQHYVTAMVPGTSWRIVVRDPEAQLFTFLDGTDRWLAWLAIAGLAVAGLAIIVLFTRLQGRPEQLTRLNTELARLALVDPLTGVRNRRAIDDYLHDALSAARRHDLALSVLVLDIDHFKTVNDTLGHRSGDAVLAHTARVLDGALRAEDAIGRWGGEEFLIVLTSTDEEGALRATERVREALAADQPAQARAHGLVVTVTIGVAEWCHEDMDELVTRADSALYFGKAAGRDNVQVSSPPSGTAAAAGPV